MAMFGLDHRLRDKLRDLHEKMEKTFKRDKKDKKYQSITFAITGDRDHGRYTTNGEIHKAFLPGRHQIVQEALKYVLGDSSKSYDIIDPEVLVSTKSTEMQVRGQSIMCSAVCAPFVFLMILRCCESQNSHLDTSALASTAYANASKNGNFTPPLNYQIMITGSLSRDIMFLSNENKVKRVTIPPFHILFFMEELRHSGAPGTSTCVLLHPLWSCGTHTHTLAFVSAKKQGKTTAETTMQSRVSPFTPTSTDGSLPRS